MSCAQQILRAIVTEAYWQLQEKAVGERALRTNIHVHDHVDNGDSAVTACLMKQELETAPQSTAVEGKEGAHTSLGILNTMSRNLRSSSIFKVHLG